MSDAFYDNCFKQVCQGLGHKTRDMSYDRLPRSLPESRPALSVEVHGFVIWISTFVAIFCYVFFAFVPDEHLQYLGITYYPHKYWALAIPAWLTATVVFVFFFYAAYNRYSTHDPSSLYILCDPALKVDPFARMPPTNVIQPILSTVNKEGNNKKRKVRSSESGERKGITDPTIGRHGSDNPFRRTRKSGQDVIEDNEFYDIPLSIINTLLYDNTGT